MKVSAPFSREGGVALLIVMWVLALLMVAAAELVYTLRVESAATVNFKDETTAWGLALAGINLGAAEISADYNVVAIDNGGVAFLKKDGGQINRIESIRTLDLGEGSFAYSITDESGKIDINTASWEALEELLRVCGIEKPERDVIADSIMDWRDADHEYRLNGAEDDYYGGLANPYGAKDAPFDSVEELLLVRGMTPERLYGKGAGGPVKTGLYGFLTARGNRKININTAPEAVLEAMLGKGRASEIILKRETEGYFDKAAFGGDVTSSIFTIHSIGTVRGLRSGIRAIVEKSRGRVRVSYWNEEGTGAGDL